jgi:hypothetical protein
MTYVVQIQKEKRSHFVESVTTVLLINSDFRKMKTKRGRAFEKCRKKAWSSSDFRLGSLAFEDSGTHHYPNPNLFTQHRRAFMIPLHP